MKRRQKILLGRILAAAALFAVGLFLNGWWKAGFMLASWLAAGYDIVWSALRNILRGQVFDEKFLMTLATVCALAMQDWGEAAAVMVLFQIGELFEQLAVERSRRSISALMDIRPDFATVLRDGEEIVTDPEEVQPGDILLYGHTHIPQRTQKDGIAVLNPGSVSLPKAGSRHAYMTWENGLFLWKDLLTGESFDPERKEDTP